MNIIDRENLLKEYAHLKQPGAYFEFGMDYKIRSWSNEDEPNDPNGGYVSETIYPKPMEMTLEQLFARHYFTSAEWAEKTMQGTVENYLENRLLLTTLSPEEASRKIEAVVKADDTFEAHAYVPPADKILNSLLLMDDPYDKQVFYEIENYLVIVAYKHIGKMS